MNWEAIGAIAELAGAAAVVLTLVYLAIQVRQNTAAMEENRKVELANNYDRRARTRVELSTLTASNPDIAELWLRLEENGWPEDTSSIDVLTPLEQRRIMSLSIAQVINLESNFYQYSLGLVDDSIYERSVGFANRMLPAW